MIALDTILDKLINTNYYVDELTKSRIFNLATAAKQYSDSLVEAIDEIVERFNFLSQQENAYQNFAKIKYNVARENIEKTNMTLIMP